MKTNLLILLASTLIISCASNKKSSDSTSKAMPVAEISLAPGHIQTRFEISEIASTDNQKIITAIVLEVLNYGSSVEPIPAGTVIKFSMSNDLAKEMNNSLKPKEIFNAILFNEGGSMKMGNEQSAKLWKLITINN